MFSYLTSPLTKRRSSVRRLTVGALAAGLLSGSVVLLPAAAEASGTTLQVTTTADVAANAGACGNSGITTAPSPLSLREATCLAENIGGPVTINVGFGTYHLVNGELQVGVKAGDNITINGASMPGTVIDGGGLSRVLNVDPNSVGGVTTNIAGLTIRGGADDTFGGAGILAGSGNASTADTMTLNYVIVTDNHANVAAPATTNSPGGGMRFYGGSLTVNNATFSDNSSGNSPGSGLEYFSVPGLAGQQLTVSGSTFSGNSSTASAAGVANGGALALQGSNGAYTITNTRFTGNSVAGSGTGTPVGAAIWSENGAMTLTGSTFTGNSVSGGSTPSGGAVQMTSGSMTAHYNRFTGNTAPSGSAIAANVPVSATDNWWGCNTGPGTSGCDTVAGSGVSTSPRLVMTASASPAAVVGPNGTSTITADLTNDSVGASIAGNQLSAFDGLPVTWSDPAGDATVGATSSTLSSGRATTSFNSHTTVGAENVNATLDNATVAAALAVNQAPSITSPNSAAFSVGSAGSFTVTTAGYPAPALSMTGTLPTGLTFTDNGNGTATIAGTPTGSGGSFPLNLTANNGVSPNATQTLTLSVGQPPAFTSPSTATFVRGTAGSFTVATSGVPTVATVAKTGTLPAGMTFTDNGNGTATVAGIPTASGTFPVSLTAANGVSPNATQTLTIQVNEAPAITTNPTDQTVQPSTSVTFTAAASGVPTPTVQWQRSTDGGASFSNIAGATSTSYTFTAAAGDNGNQYRAVFTNVAGSATSTAATLNVGTAPAFTSANQALFTVGAPGSFSIATTGVPSATLSRTGASFPAWLTLTDNGDGTGSLTGTPPAGSGGDYAFTLKAANGFSPSASQSFTLHVSQPPAITSAPTATFRRGTAGTFTVTTSGWPSSLLSESGSLPAGVTFTSHAGGTATIAGTPTAGGSYPITVTASNGFLSNATQAFTLTVEQPAGITSADHTTFTTGSAGSFTVTTTPGQPTATTLTETGSLPSGVTFTDNGDGTATLAGSPAAGSGGTHSVTVTASNGIAPDAGQSFTLTVNEAPVVTTQPSNATVAPGQSVTFSAAATGFPAPAVKWQQSTDDGSTFADVPGANGTDLTFSADLTDSSTRFRAVFTNSTDHVETTAGVLTVGIAPAITSASTAAMTVGSAGSFTVTATGTPTPQITQAGALPAGVTFTDNGHGTATLAGTPATGSAGTYPIALTAGNGIGSAATQTLTLTVSPPPVVVPGAPTVGTAMPGDGSATVSFTPPGSNGGAPITGYTVTSSPGGKTATGTGSPITVGGLTDGTRYTFTVRATNSAGTGAASAASNAVTPAISPITWKYLQLGGLRSLLGAPTGSEYALAGGSGRDFQQGRIYYSPATGAHEVHGAILQRFLTLGGPTGLLGYPTTDETRTATGSGRYNHFAGADGASIFWSPATGAWSIHGAIRNKWISMGAEHGLLGYPTTDETRTAFGTGRYNHFAGADGASIFWSPATGAWSIHGSIRAKWIALGAEHGQLGYPVSDESEITGGRRNTFVHGWLLWRPNGQLTVVYR